MEEDNINQHFITRIEQMRDKIFGLSKFDIDAVEVCKDCEFRYVCVTNIKRKKNQRNTLINTTECNYNPYIAKWKGEDGYRTLSECGVISNEHEFSIDHERIAKINEELWGE